jgi:hypothetical protein
MILWRQSIPAIAIDIAEPFCKEISCCKSGIMKGKGDSVGQLQFWLV